MFHTGELAVYPVLLNPLLASVTAWLLVVVEFVFKYIVAVVAVVLPDVELFPLYVIVNVLWYTAYNVFATLYAGDIFAAAVVTAYVLSAAVVFALYPLAVQFVIAVGAGMPSAESGSISVVVKIAVDSDSDSRGVNLFLHSGEAFDSIAGTSG